MGSLGGLQRRKAALEIGEVVDILQADVEPQRRPAGGPFGRGAILQSNGMMRLSSRPKSPLPNGLTVSSRASTACCGTGFRTC